MRTSFGGQRGVGATEYVILVTLAAVVIITVVSRFGKTVGGQVDSTRESVQRLGNEQNGHAAERESAPTLEGDRNSQSEPDESSRSGTKPEALPDAVDTPYGKTIDSRIFILLGFGGLMAILIVMAMAKRRKKDRRPSSLPELRDDKTARHTRTTDAPQ